jgi:hypothetical protein
MFVRPLVPKHLGARNESLHAWGSALTHRPALRMIVPGGRILTASAGPPAGSSPRSGQELQLFGKHPSHANAQAFGAYLAPPWCAGEKPSAGRRPIFTKAEIRVGSP